jgi:hypothetical protein
MAPSALSANLATKSVRDTAKLHLVKSIGNTLYEEGRVSGTLPGTARVTLHLGVSSATSTFTFHLRGGSITGSGSAKLKPGKNGRYDSFGGTASIRHGTGRYAHASGTGGLYGVVDRSNYSAEVQVIGTLRF